MLPLVVIALVGCKSSRPAIVVATTTTLGFKIGQNPSTQMYNAELGYVRVEAAYVPLTNGTVPDVITEMKFNGLNNGGGFHQRLSVGPVACSQNASMLMFARDHKGRLESGLSSMLLGTTNAPANLK